MSTYAESRGIDAPTAALIEKILVGGKDVTVHRGKRLPDVARRNFEPIGYGDGIIRIPHLRYHLESHLFGQDDLSWVREGLIVVVQACDPETGAVVKTRWRGRTERPRPDGKGTMIPCGGLLAGPAEMKNKQIPVRREVKDIGRLAWEAIVRAWSGFPGVTFSPRLGPAVGIEIVETGGMTYLGWLHHLCSFSTKRNGEQHTIMPVTWGSGEFEMRLKDTTTIHYTVVADGSRVEVDLSRDEHYTSYFLSGIREDGGYWDGMVAPGVFQDPNPPAYPGAPLSVGSSSENVGKLHWRMINIGRLSVEEQSNTFDATTENIVEDIQQKAGLPQTGIVDEATWNKFFDIDVRGWTLAGAHIEPLVEDIRTREWLVNSAGNYVGRNPDHDPTIVPRHRNVDLGYGLTKQQGINWGKGQMAKSADAKVGTITLNGCGVFAGDWSTGTPTAADVISARDIEPGTNILILPAGEVVHISETDLQPGEDTSPDRVTLTVDSGARDALELSEILERNRESQRNPTREWKKEFRGSRKIPDGVTPWRIDSGILPADIDCKGDKWTVVPIFAGGAGTLSLVDIRTQDPPAEHCGAVFADRIGPRIIAKRIGNPFPLDDDRQPVWADPALDDWYERRFLLYSYGDEEQPGGYWPREHTNDDREVTSAPLNGRWRDDASVGYHTLGGTPALWYAIRPDRDTVLKRGRLFRVQHDSGV